MSDELTGIFNDLNPADFDRLTSNVHEWRLRPRHQSRTFKQWVVDGVLHLRGAYVASDGNMIPFAVLENSDWARLFVPDDDESLGDFLLRLHAEAVALEASRFFMAKQTFVDAVDPGQASESVGDMSADEQQQARVGLLYYAATRKPGHSEHSSGVIFTDAGKLQEEVAAPPYQRIPLFEAVLRGVPFEGETP